MSEENINVEFGPRGEKLLTEKHISAPVDFSEFEFIDSVNELRDKSAGYGIVSNKVKVCEVPNPSKTGHTTNQRNEQK